MKRPALIDPEQAYTFSDYFELNPPVGELIEYFGYQHKKQFYQLPQKAIDESYFVSLSQHLNEILYYVELANNTARREVFIAPVLLKVVCYLKIRMDIGYDLHVTEQLCGTFDYLLRGSTIFPVVAAKNGNAERGFTELAVELIALDQRLENKPPILYGAVSVGRVWQFSLLACDTKTVIQDLNQFRVPADLMELLRILTAILQD